MKILLTTGIYPPDIGGPATYAKILSDGLLKRGHKVSVVSFSSVMYLPKIIRHFAFMFKILINIKDVDIILAQDTVSVGLPSVLVSNALSIPIVIRVPGDFAWEQGVQRFSVKENIDDFQNKKYGFRVETLRKIQKFVVRSADFVITPSDYFLKIVSGWGVRPKNIKRIYNGVSIPEKIEEKKVTEKTVVSSGRLVPWKGFDLLIRSLKDSNYNLVIIGDGPDKERLVNIAKENNVLERVIFTGKLKREELLSYVLGSKVFVLPTSFESFSFMLVEAMMLGKPVVSFNIGNLKEIIDNGVNGILLEEKDPKILSQTIDGLIKDEELLKNMGTKAKEKSKEFSSEILIDNIENLFKKMI